MTVYIACKLCLGYTFITFHYYPVYPVSGAWNTYCGEGCRKRRMPSWRLSTDGTSKSASQPDTSSPVMKCSVVSCLPRSISTLGDTAHRESNSIDVEALKQHTVRKLLFRSLSACNPAVGSLALDFSSLVTRQVSWTSALSL